MEPLLKDPLGENIHFVVLFSCCIQQHIRANIKADMIVYIMVNNTKGKDVQTTRGGH